MTHPARGPITTLDELSADWFVRPGDVVFDIGVHVGTTTAAYLKRGAMVFAFEPLTRTRARMPETLRSNPRVKLFPFALSDRSGPQEIFVPKRNPGAASLSRAFFEAVKVDETDSGGTEVVESRTLDELELPRAKFWKIDVEGAELAMLRGSEMTLRDSPPDVIQLEIFRMDVDRYHDTMEFLWDHFPHVWGIGATPEGRPIHHEATPTTVAMRQFHADLLRGGTPHYYASQRPFADWLAAYREGR